MDLHQLQEIDNVREASLVTVWLPSVSGWPPLRLSAFSKEIPFSHMYPQLREIEWVCTALGGGQLAWVTQHGLLPLSMNCHTMLDLWAVQAALCSGMPMRMLCSARRQ